MEEKSREFVQDGGNLPEGVGIVRKPGRASGAARLRAVRRSNERVLRGTPAR